MHNYKLNHILWCHHIWHYYICHVLVDIIKLMLTVFSHLQIHVKILYIHVKMKHIQGKVFVVILGYVLKWNVNFFFTVSRYNLSLLMIFLYLIIDGLNGRWCNWERNRCYGKLLTNNNTTKMNPFSIMLLLFMKRNSKPKNRYEN